MLTFAVIGAGNAGCAFAAHLKQLGHETRLYDVFETQLADPIAAGNVLTIGGNIDLPGTENSRQVESRIDYIGTDLEAAVSGADILLCTAPAHAHRKMAEDLSAHLKPGQVVVLNPGRTCGAIEVSQVFRDRNVSSDVTVVEAQTLLYACRRSANSVHVFGVKERVSCAARPADQLNRFLDLIQPVLPQFQAAEEGIWQTSLDNIGMLFHPTPTLFNLGRMETGEPFDYYHDGMSPTIAAMVEKLDAERCAVAEAMGVTIPNVIQWLEITYGAQGSNLFEAIQNNDSYTGIVAPQLDGVDAKRNLRYVVEDVPTGLVPVSELGRRIGVATPHIDLIISLADKVYERDFRREGRNLERLGLAELSVEELQGL